MSVIVERSALDTSLRKFDVLQQGQALYYGERLRSYFVRHVDDRR